MLIQFQCPNCKKASTEDVIAEYVQPLCMNCKTFMEPWNGTEFKRIKQTKELVDVRN